MKGMPSQMLVMIALANSQLPSVRQGKGPACMKPNTMLTRPNCSSKSAPRMASTAMTCGSAHGTMSRAR